MNAPASKKAGAFLCTRGGYRAADMPEQEILTGILKFKKALQ